METLLFTGASGFLGNNILPPLRKQYGKIITLGRGKSNDIIADLATEVPNMSEKVDVVLHAAGKAHTVPHTEEEKQAFFEVNVNGTKNLCKALNLYGLPKSFIFISTVAVYGGSDGEIIDESHALNGTTPYAKSKIIAEEYLTQWASRNNVTLTILRPSLLAGKNPPGNLKSMINGIKKGYYFNISPGTMTKSILMAEDIAYILPNVKNRGGVFNICDTAQPTIKEISILIAHKLGRKKPLEIPYRLVYILAKIGDFVGGWFRMNTYRLDKLTKSRIYLSDKAIRELNWKPMNVLENFKIR